MSDDIQTQHSSLQEMLADMTRDFPEEHSIPRYWAGQVLENVGSNIAWGNSDSGHSPRSIGWALLRVFSVYDEKALPELIKGYQEATAYYADATIPEDLKPKTSVE